MRLRHVLSLDLMKGYRSFQIILQQNINNCNKYIKLYVHFHSVQCLRYWTNVK